MIQILFFLFAALAVGSAINVLVQKHVLYSSLSLIVMLTSVSGLFILLQAEFLAVINVIVYAGAIMVLFVFTIMLLNAGEEERTRGSRVALLFGVPGMLVGSILIAWILLRYSDTQAVSMGALPGTPTAIALLLFHDFLLPFEVTSVLILIAIMGAVVLASRETLPPPEERRQR